MNVEIENQLKDELRQRAGSVPTRSDPYALVHRRIVRSGRRRTGALVACVAALLVAAIVAVPGLLDSGRRDAVVNPPPSPRVDGSAGSPMTWPTRGSLAGDRAYVQQAARWLAERAGTASDVNVLYAGDVGNKRLIVGAYEGTDKSRPVQIVSLAGEAGSDQKLKESPAPWFRPPAFDHLVAFLVPAEPGKRDQRTTVVVLPDSSVRALTYSLQPTIQPDGDVERAWTALIDEDSEPGVVTARLDAERIAPGALRIGGTRGEEEPGVESQPEDFSGVDDSPRTPLREMAEEASGDEYIGELAPALQLLELSDLGWEQITSVRIPWRVDRDGEWVGLEIGLAGGGVIEAVLTTSHTSTLEGTGMARESVLYAIRAVPADQAGREPFFWWGPGEDSCQLYGYVPEQLAATELPEAKVAGADVMIEGEKSGIRPAANGQAATVDYCDLASKADPGSVLAPVVRLLDENGKKLWSGAPVGRYTGIAFE